MLFRLFLVIFYAHVMVYTLCASICPMYAQNVYLYKRQSKKIKIYRYYKIYKCNIYRL